MDAGKPWKVENGYVEVVPNAGSIRTKETFGDVQLHVEWAAPAPCEATARTAATAASSCRAATRCRCSTRSTTRPIADGQAGAIYGQWPPLVNAVRRPGEWQSYDIVFEAPRVEGGTVVKPAYLTVFLNGVLVHHRKEAMGPTVHRALAAYASQPAEDSLVLQDHQQPVRYRNIWIRRLAGYDRRP